MPLVSLHVLNLTGKTDKGIVCLNCRDKSKRPISNANGLVSFRLTRHNLVHGPLMVTRSRIEKGFLDVAASKLRCRQIQAYRQHDVCSLHGPGCDVLGWLSSIAIRLVTLRIPVRGGVKAVLKPERLVKCLCRGRHRAVALSTHKR